MTKTELDAAVAAALAEGKMAVETILDKLNPGQRKKLVKNPTVAALLERYGVEVDV